jgi:hypothetical protein
MKKISLLISLTILTTCLVLLNQANISAADDAAPPTALERLTKLPYLESDVGRQQQPLSPVSTTLSPWSRLVFQSFRDLNRPTTIRITHRLASNKNLTLICHCQQQ